METHALILESLREALRRHLHQPLRDIAEDAPLRVFVADSLELLELIFMIEEDFGIELPLSFVGDRARRSPTAEWTLRHLADWIAAARTTDAPSIVVTR